MQVLDMQLMLGLVVNFSDGYELDACSDGNGGIEAARTDLNNLYKGEKDKTTTVPLNVKDLTNFYWFATMNLFHPSFCFLTTSAMSEGSSEQSAGAGYCGRCHLCESTTDPQDSSSTQW